MLILVLGWDFAHPLITSIYQIASELGISRVKSELFA